ncbi:glycosyltransferase [Phocaeicola sartorii]|uniref:glycosyltransferase n=1 Tax=Phocaeicola sartorii TaxID=671267 RepID=UPI002557DB69|nr:glycosyltransferase [Phocaeicola sartorii]
MNILFLLKSFGIGGLEIVSQTLANKFVAKGHNVVCFAFAECESTVADRLDEKVNLYVQNSYEYNSENIASLRQCLLENSIDVIINQWGLPYLPVKIATEASKGLNVKIVSVHHNSPDANGMLQAAKLHRSEQHWWLGKYFYSLKYYILRLVTGLSMRYVYSKSDIYMVLSQSFVEKFKKFTFMRNPDHLIVQTNPVTVKQPDCIVRQDKKREILYVGRLDSIQKKVSRVIDVWSLLEHQYPDWNLVIVGDGPARQELQNQALKLGLSRISFEGFKSPVEYYKRASILMLTSDFEGFPLVLPECMSFGVVPVVYGSYSAVYDIIDGNNGLVSEPQFGKFSAENMTDCVSSLMSDEQLLMKMSSAAVKTAEKYSIDTIYQSWMNILNNLVLKEGK